MPPAKPRSITSVLRWVLPLAMVLACTEHGPESPPNPSPSLAAKVTEPAPAEPTKATAPVAPTEPATPTEPAKPPEPATPTEPTEPTEPAAPTEPANPAVPAGDEPGTPREPTDAERVDAYVASCSHRFTVVPEEWSEEGDPEGAAINECEYYEWDQNCSYDPSGCWEAGQECIRSCAKPCNTCQDECAGGCDQCKAACAPGSTECTRKCAESRLACRTKCMVAASACEYTDCPKQEAACNEAFDQKRKKKCPQCAEISAFIEQNHGGEDYDKACARAFPKANKVCFDWCMEYYEDEE